MKNLSTGIEASATGESLNSGDPAVHPAARHKPQLGKSINLEPQEEENVKY